MALTRVRVKIDGTWITLAYNSATGRYEGYYTPTRTSFHQPGGYFNVEAEASNSSGLTAEADGSVFDGLRLPVRETTAPGLTLVSPPQGYVTVKRPAIVMDAVDEPDGSGIDPGSFLVVMDGAAQTAGKSTAAIAGGYRLTWRPAANWSEGRHLVTFSISDHDGNQVSASAAYTTDTEPPSLWVTLPGWNRVVDVASAYIRAQAFDLTSGPAVVSASNNGKTISMKPAEPEAGEFYDVYDALVPLEVGENNITITARDGAGWTTKQSIYMIRLITDRVQADVDRLTRMFARGGIDTWTDEELEWFNMELLRGSYDAEDLTRVRLAVAYLAQVLMQYFGFNPHISGQGGWETEDVPVRTDMAAYLADVATIRDAQGLAELSDLLLPETIRFLNFVGANQIEEALVFTDDFFDRYSWWSSGEISSGEA